MTERVAMADGRSLASGLYRAVLAELVRAALRPSWRGNPSAISGSRERDVHPEGSLPGD